MLTWKIDGRILEEKKIQARKKQDSFLLQYWHALKSVIAANLVALSNSCFVTIKYLICPFWRDYFFSYEGKATWAKACVSFYCFVPLLKASRTNVDFVQCITKNLRLIPWYMHFSCLSILKRCKRYLVLVMLIVTLHDMILWYTNSNLNLTNLSAVKWLISRSQEGLFSLGTWPSL